MKTSARNQFHGRIDALTKGTVNAEVVVALNERDRLVAVITNASLDNPCLCAWVRRSTP